MGLSNFSALHAGMIDTSGNGRGAAGEVFEKAPPCVKKRHRWDTLAVKRDCHGIDGCWHDICRYCPTTRVRYNVAAGKGLLRGDSASWYPQHVAMYIRGDCRT